MAILSVATPAIGPGDGHNPLERDPNVAPGLLGVIQIMERYTYRGDPGFNQLGKLTDQELVTIRNRLTNEQTSLVTGLQTLGDLVSCFDPDKSTLDHNAVGWLVKTLAVSLEGLADMGWAAGDELSRRGYDSHGQKVTHSGAR